MKPPLSRADGRPRIHVWPTRQGVMWSIGPKGSMTWAEDAGAAVNAALAHLSDRANSGAVVILEETGRA